MKGGSSPEGGVKTEDAAWKADAKDPLSRPVQVAWTSARARYCGFVFDPNQLRTSYLSAEQRAGNSEAQMRKIEKAYDYTVQSVTDSIKSNSHYCTKDRTTAIRKDLKQYLSGNFTHRASPAD
ncbi:hypothetical protein V6C03_09740 [Methyloligella sp. 2.7D]|uniref:hypothetical protein n=1 Tax=unclassified Methyloligella TaxID=2625955 RepID=UPI00157DEB32|nr:hypothetical protein [Methyloligella sp. GL2]QKP77872.1 hypothetical protein HT051_10715 [Methyloligella sp. GL2]